MAKSYSFVIRIYANSVNILIFWRIRKHVSCVGCIGEYFIQKWLIFIVLFEHTKICSTTVQIYKHRWMNIEMFANKALYQYSFLASTCVFIYVLNTWFRVTPHRKSATIIYKLSISWGLTCHNNFKLTLTLACMFALQRITNK